MPKTEGSSFLRALGLLWGEGAGGSRGPKPELSLDAIVAAAIDIADREGLEALSMRRVSERLGFTSMSLYRHVPGKDELVEIMRDVALGTPPSLARPQGHRAKLVKWAEGILARHEQHPWLLAMELRGPPFGPNHLLWFEAALAVVEPLGLPGRDAVSVIVALDAYVRGAAGVRIGLAREARRTGSSAEGLARAGTRFLERALQDPRYPTMARLGAAGAFAPIAEPPDEFAFGLARVLDGLDAMLPKKKSR